jgi:hypothetical protein
VRGSASVGSPVTEAEAQHVRRVSDAERHARTQEVNDRAKKAIADARLRVNDLNRLLDTLDGTVTLRKVPPRAQR